MNAPRPKSPRRKRLAFGALLVGAVALGSQLWPVSSATRATWVEDLDRLERHTASAYANLFDRLASRKLSPRDLDRQARAALARARSQGEARAALTAFVDAFADRHFVATAPFSAPRRWLRDLLGKERPQGSAPFSWSLSGEDACSRLGVRDRREGDLDWQALPGFDPLSGDAVSHPFPAGILVRGARDGGPLAILRIGLFSQQGFAEICAAEWERLQLASRPERECDAACQDDFWDGLEERLLDRFAAELGELKAAGARELLVDLTGNGGGSGIVGRMVRMVTTAPLPERAFGFIRHPHSVERFRRLAADYAAEAERQDLPERQRALYAAIAARVSEAARAADAPCDLAGLWTSAEVATLPCTNVARAEPWLSPAERAELAALEALEESAEGTRAEARPVAWQGALLVLTDARTASASEDFAASLQDAGAATIVGQTTMGVGCGYTNGGVTLELPATGLTVKAPDCIRYRRDGRNEAEGVLPDLPVEWERDDSAAERAEKVHAALALSRGT